MEDGKQSGFLLESRGYITVAPVKTYKRTLERFSFEGKRSAVKSSGYITSLSKKSLAPQRISNRELRLTAIPIKTGSMYLGFYTNRWQVCLKGARRQRNFRSEAWFRSRGCSKNHVFRQPQGCPQYTISGCYLPTSDTRLTRGASPLSSRPVRCAESSTPSRNMVWSR